MSAPPAVSPPLSPAAASPRSVRIRRLGETDAAAFRSLRLQCLRDHPTAFISDWASESAKPLSATVQRLQTQVLLGAFDTLSGAEPLIGMIGLDREARPQNRHKAHVVAVYVAPRYIGQGIARQLMEAAMQHAQRDGVERLVLSVTQGNDRAQGLYERMGFTVFGREPDGIRVTGPDGVQSLSKVLMTRAIGPTAPDTASTTPHTTGHSA